MDEEYDVVLQESLLSSTPSSSFKEPPIKTLAQLEALPELEGTISRCMSCGKPTPSSYCEIIVYRDSEGKNISFEQARRDPSATEVVTAGVSPYQEQ